MKSEFVSVQTSTWQEHHSVGSTLLPSCSLTSPDGFTGRYHRAKKQECPGVLWLRWDRSSSRDTPNDKRLGPGPSLGDGAGLTMAWDESLGMERQSSDEMVAQDRGTAATALVSLPPTALWQSHTSTGSEHRSVSPSSVSGQAGCKSQVPPHAMPPRGWH